MIQIRDQENKKHTKIFKTTELVIIFEGKRKDFFQVNV